MAIRKCMQRLEVGDIIAWNACGGSPPRYAIRIARIRQAYGTVELDAEYVGDGRKYLSMTHWSFTGIQEMLYGPMLPSAMLKERYPND